jgi:hypothetical protein
LRENFVQFFVVQISQFEIRGGKASGLRRLAMGNQRLQLFFEIACERPNGFFPENALTEGKRDRIQSLEDALEQVEGIGRQRERYPERIENMNKSEDQVKYWLKK